MRSLIFGKNLDMEMPKVTEREFEVLHLLAHEFTTVEIADRLYISYETAKSHRKHLLMKLNVRNVAGLIRRGFETGMLELKMAH